MTTTEKGGHIGMDILDYEFEDPDEKKSKKKKRKKESKKPMSEAKIRLIAFIVTTLLCAAIVVLGLKYIDSIRSKSNAEVFEENSVSETGAAVSEVTESTSYETTGASAAAVIVTSASTSASVQAVSASTQAVSASTGSGVPQDDDSFVISGYANDTGCYMFWKYGEEYSGCTLDISVTDGRESYGSVAEVPIEAGKAELSSPEYSGTVGAKIVIFKTIDGQEMTQLEKLILIDNASSASVEAGDPYDAFGAAVGYDPSVLIR